MNESKNRAAPPGGGGAKGASADAQSQAGARAQATGYEHLGLEPTPVHPEWGHNPEDHFGYASDAERLAKRGMEDWELVSKIPASQRRIPYWFIAVVVIVLLVAVGLGFPFWGQRPGVKIEWFNWGFVAAIVYVAVAATFVYFMTNLYGSERAGRLDSDPESEAFRASADAEPRRKAE
jgi:hypothetical protein